MQTILLLHGALGSMSDMEPLAKILSEDYDVRTLNFSGHGGRAATRAPLSIELFAGEVLEYLEVNELKKVVIFGYSMGGYVGMYLARHYPEKISRVITLATKFHWDADVAANEVKMLDPERIELKVPAFAASLSKKHSPGDWKELMRGTAKMMTRLGTNNTLKSEDRAVIEAPCLLLLGDRDKMISLEETVQTYKLLPNGQMGMLPDTGHQIEKLRLTEVASLITGFLTR